MYVLRPHKPEPHLHHQVPLDFCVHQDTLSENVSTEHVDFLLARQQWKKMEEEVRGQPIPKPGLKAQGSFQGTHTSLYPPTRSPRLKHRSEATLGFTVLTLDQDLLFLLQLFNPKYTFFLVVIKLLVGLLFVSNIIQVQMSPFYCYLNVKFLFLLCS